MRAYLVDDEPLALRRLARLLEESGKVTITGSATDPVAALEELPRLAIDVLFLDIQMPELSGFDLLSRLESAPFVVFTTAYDQYALQAFEVNSVDYLVKPVEKAQLARALGKLERILRGAEPRPRVDPGTLDVLIGELAKAMQPSRRYLQRIASRTGDRVQFIELDRITHFFAEDKLTFAATEGKRLIVDFSINELEHKLDPEVFFRIHRSTLLNLRYLLELDTWFAGRAIVRLKDSSRTELQVARDRVRMLRDRLGV